MESAERNAVVMLAGLGTSSSFASAYSFPSVSTAHTSPITHDSPPTTTPTGATDVASINATAVATNAATTANNPLSSTTTTADIGNTPDAVGPIDAGKGTSTALGSTREGSAPNGTIVVAAAPPPTPKKAKKEKPKAAEPARKSTRAAAARGKKAKVPA